MQNIDIIYNQNGIFAIRVQKDEIVQCKGQNYSSIILSTKEVKELIVELLNNLS